MLKRLKLPLHGRPLPHARFLDECKTWRSCRVASDYFRLGYCSLLETRLRVAENSNGIPNLFRILPKRAVWT